MIAQLAAAVVSAEIVQWNVARALLVVFLLFLVVVKCLLRKKPSRFRLPPGPYGLPLLGYLPFLDRRAPYASLNRLNKKYGKIFSVNFGNVFVVVLSDYKLIRHAFSKEVFAGRPPLYITNGIMEGYGLICAEGEIWKEQRKFVISCFRDFGVNKYGLNRDSLQQRILKELTVFIDKIRQLDGSAVDLNNLLGFTIGNVTTSMVLGVRYEDDDTVFRRQLELQDEGSELVELAGALNFLPYLRFLSWYKKGYDHVLSNKKETHDFLRSVVEDHRRTLDPANIRDFLDAYMVEMKRKDSVNFTTYYSDKQLLHILADLFGAGIETTKTTLRWLYLYMVVHPEIQEKVSEEIITVVGRDRVPTLDDMANLPFTEATILEAQRLSNVAPFGAPHGTLQDTVLDGYFIPRQAMVISLLYAVHMDPELWEQPEKFDPTRFLNGDGKVFKPDYFMPYCHGRRMCVGEELAKMELFVFFSALLQTFRLTLPEDCPSPDLTPVSGFTLFPKPYKIKAVLR